MPGPDSLTKSMEKVFVAKEMELKFWYSFCPGFG